MEKQIRSFYYIGLEDLKDSKTEKKEKYRTRKQQNPIPVYRVEKKLFFGKEELVLYFSLLPTGFREEIRKKRKRKQWEEKILQAVSYAENALFCRGYEVLFGKGIGTEQEIPAELFGACLTENPCGYAGELSQLSLSLPADGGSSVTEKAMFLLTPFLSGINRVIFAGEETDNSQQIEDFLFFEYGIIMTYDKRPAKKGVWLDFDGNSCGLFENFAAENGIYHLNSAEVLKFLDTTVKNGYNTKVN